MNRERELVDEGKEKRKKKVHPVLEGMLSSVLVKISQDLIGAQGIRCIIQR